MFAGTRLPHSTLSSRCEVVPLVAVINVPLVDSDCLSFTGWITRVFLLMPDASVCHMFTGCHEHLSCFYLTIKLYMYLSSVDHVTTVMALGIIFLLLRAVMIHVLSCFHHEQMFVYCRMDHAHCCYWSVVDKLLWLTLSEWEQTIISSFPAVLILADELLNFYLNCYARVYILLLMTPIKMYCTSQRWVKNLLAPVCDGCWQTRREVSDWTFIARINTRLGSVIRRQDFVTCIMLSINLHIQLTLAQHKIHNSTIRQLSTMQSCHSKNLSH